MRRPAPLPAEQRPERPPRDRAPSTPASEMRAPATPAPQTPASGKPAAEGTAPDEVTLVRSAMEEEDAQLTQRDLWRAARARRKVLKAEIRRFTQRSRRRRLVWLCAIGALVVLVGGSVAAAYSPLFAVEKITVAGASTLDAASVEAALSDQLGTPLASIDPSAVKAALTAFPLIETYALEANPPHDLTVRIVERTPVGMIASDAGYTVVDAAGVPLTTTDGQPVGQPLLEIDGGVDSDAFISAGLVVRSLPAALRAELTRVVATSADDVTLSLGTRTVVWGSADDSPLKARVLAGLVATNPDALSFDVSAPNVGVVR